MGWKNKKSEPPAEEKAVSSQPEKLTTPTFDAFPFPGAGAPKSPGLSQRNQNPFATPGSIPGTPRGARTPGSVLRASTTAFHLPASRGNTYFKSRRIRDVSSIAKPWTEVKDPKKKWHTIVRRPRYRRVIPLTKTVSVDWLVHRYRTGRTRGVAGYEQRDQQQILFCL